MNSGIYCIKNKINNKKYIGRAKNIRERFSKHKRQLKNKNHVNKYLQDSWNKYGEENFEFNVILFSPTFLLSILEIIFIMIFRTKSPNGYNLTSGGEGSTGFKHSRESLNKISVSHRKENLSDETLERMRKSAHREKRSQEIRNKISKSHIGKHPSQESIRKSALSRTGRKAPKETGEKIAMLVQGIKVAKNASSLYCGVYLSGKRWMARISYNGKREYLGHYNTDIEAAEAYDLKAIEYYGNNANINFEDKRKFYIEKVGNKNE